MKEKIWTCCRCGSSPNNYDFLEFCAECGHDCCPACQWETFTPSLGEERHVAVHHSNQTAIPLNDDLGAEEIALVAFDVRISLAIFIVLG
jgi:hypothetical protein